MPILREVENQSLELSQGDILQDVALFTTSTDGQAKLLAQHKLAMVISRDCAAVNKNSINVVALQRKANTKLDPESTFDDVRSFLTGLRDGDEHPDRFYLGSFPGKDSRFVALLDALFTIEIPGDLANRSEWVKAHRLACLSDPFVRALPVRLFGSVARAGFDDFSWYSDADLKLLMAAGRAQEAKLATAVAMAAVAIENAKSSHGGEKELDAHEKARKKAEESLVALQQVMAPYGKELAAREVSPQGIAVQV